MKTTIIQISDLHISAEGNKVGGIDSRANLSRLLQKFRQQAWDLLVVSGDLAATAGEIEAYCWLKLQLDSLQRPYILLAGNHDKVAVMRQVFDLPHEHEELFYRYEINGLPLLCLDSSDNTLSAHQLQWLHQQDPCLSQAALLFIHHPPLDCQCTFMDAHYPLLNRQQVWPQLQQLQQIKHIFCGHYHTAKRLYRDGKWIYLCPSTMNQINTLHPNYIANAQPCWRQIQWDGRNLHSRIHVYNQSF